MRGRRGLAVVGAAAALAAVLPVLAHAAAPSRAPAGEWLAGDLHVHTTYSHDSYGGPSDDNTGPEDGYTAGFTVGQEFALAKARGLDYLAITDHNDIRSQSDPGFGTDGVLPIHGYENSLKGHAQMLGARRLYDNGDASASAVNRLADELRDDGGVFQANHPVDGVGDDPHFHWTYGDDVRPDTIEVWNIARFHQPPNPASSNNDAAIAWWEHWLDQGAHIGATGGSDSHWITTSQAQGAGQPTTWVLSRDRSERGVLDGIRAGHTFISWQPPNLGGPKLFLEGDEDGDGTFESVVGDTVKGGAALRVRVEGAPGSQLRVITDGGQLAFGEVPVSSTDFEHRFTLPAGATWVRAEIVEPDLKDQRRATCDPVVGDQTSYCRNQILVLAMTSALYLHPRGQGEWRAGPVYAHVSGDRVVLGNDDVERVWSRSPFRTLSLTDKRTGRTWTANSPDFHLTLDGIPLASDLLSVEGADVEELPRHGLRITLHLGAVADRIVEAYPDVAGFRSRTVLKVPGVLSSYTLDEVAAGPGVAPTMHGFRAGSDWRAPDWQPQLAVGDANTGDWRHTSSAPAGKPLDGTAQWLTLAAPDHSSVFMVMERNDLPSSTMRYDGTTGAATVDLSRDIVSLGPLEEQGHAQNPGPGPARSRAVVPPLELESVFTGVATNPDDEPWEHHVYLARHRAAPYANAVVFNSDHVDHDRISVGAKDDMDLAEVRRQAAVARRLGVETFVLDDGWQARSGDWCPDSPQCRPANTTFPPRFPDATFSAVRDVLGPMHLGLWMSPMAYHPTSDAYTQNQTWSCAPAGTAVGLSNLADNGGSNEAGTGIWNPLGQSAQGRMIDFLESRIRTAIEQWGVRYFKFDFLVWLDCAGVAPADMYSYREAFTAMVDRLEARHPEVTFQIDETNDYRLFPFESVVRGPSWFQNGSPTTSQLLHNLWDLAPFVPGSSLGQDALGTGDAKDRSVDYRMAVALGSHLTFRTDLTALSPADVDAARDWIDFYKAHRDELAGFTYPLLDDPAGGTNWTGLQPWDLGAGRGLALVFRQNTPDATHRVPLHGLTAPSYVVRDLRTGASLGTFSRDELAGPGLPVTLSEPFSAAVLSVEPA